MSRRLLVSVFGTEHDIVGATNSARSAGYDIVDVYTPFAVHGLDRAQGITPTRLAFVCFGLGLTGALAKLGFQIWTSAWDWPVNVGGKPLISIPAFVPVTFEVMVLFAGVGTVLAFLLRSKLRPGKRAPVIYEGATNDKFVLVMAQNDAAFNIAKVQELFRPFSLVSMEERIEMVKE
ncbi:MAG: DUF3341 domain-containing protein [Ignavibacteriae bacterium]|nr:DUF3341 domain-containing protein [Ignavibacteriota bacterium]